jgi:lysophospholipase L1-like esterase
MIKNFKWLLLVSLSFVACNNDDDTPVVEEPPVVIVPGSANFSKYVALGDSFAAGYGDNALYKKGQETAYPNILAQQFALAGGGAFSTPFMADDNIGGFSAGGAQVAKFPTRLYFNGVGPVGVPGVSATVLGSSLPAPRAFNNMGVPGAKSFHLLVPGYGSPAGLAVVPATANPYFVRFASSASTSVLADALAQNPTFFSLWIGGNDVLGYATNGGVPTSQDADLGSDITPTGTFNAVYNSLASNLSAGGRKGVVAGLPYISSLPYFTTVPFNPVVLTADKVALLNGAFATYNGGLALAQSRGMITLEEKTRRTISFKVGKNPVVMVDSYLTSLAPLGLPSYRQATADDFLVLPSSSFIGTLVDGNANNINGVTVPLSDKWVLSKEEIVEVKNATDAYNVTIKAAATANNLAYVDTALVMNQLLNGGIPYDGYILKADFIFGGAFSLDGVHPTARGYAMIANMFSKAINEKYGSNLPQVKLSDYPVLRPKSF